MTDTATNPLAELETALEYRFEDQKILARALRHGSSIASDFAGSYQRLEFLGDAVLGHAVALMLFERFPGDDQGDLTRKRTHLVRSERLAERAALQRTRAVWESGALAAGRFQVELVPVPGTASMVVDSNATNMAVSLACSFAMAAI